MIDSIVSALQGLISHRVIFTLAIIFLGLTLRIVVTRRIRRTKDILDSDDRRRISNVHYLSIGFILLTILALWLPQIQHFVLSVTAIAVALVIATKELILCLTGAVLLRSSRAFVIGDWVSIGDRFGEVIECNFLTTTVQEIESNYYTSTGRTITIPNSLFLSQSVINQNFIRRYRFHRFSITIEPDAFPMDAQEKLVKRIESITEPFLETARRYNSMLEKRTGIDIPDASPTVDFSTNEIAKIVTTICIFCPTEEIAMLEKSMMREFFGWYRNNRGKTSEASA